MSLVTNDNKVFITFVNQFYLIHNVNFYWFLFFSY
jgi:hypothetical protein